MRFRILLLAGALVAFATPALADHCPEDIRRIDAALAENPALTAEQLAQVRELRDRGLERHQEDYHGEALGALHRVLAILGIGHD